MAEGDDVDRPDEPWKYPYVAAAVDFRSNIQINVLKESKMAVGYRIVPSLYIQNRHQVAIGFLDEFCENNGVWTNVRVIEQDSGGETYRLEINQRDQITRFLKLVLPYMIGRQPVAQGMVELIENIEEKQSDREGFIELMELVDEIRAATETRSEPKYTTDYFREEWDMA